MEIQNKLLAEENIKLIRKISSFIVEKGINFDTNKMMYSRSTLEVIKEQQKIVDDLVEDQKNRQFCEQYKCYPKHVL